jgi:hypothetical protein
VCGPRSGLPLTQPGTPPHRCQGSVAGRCGVLKPSGNTTAYRPRTPPGARQPSFCPVSPLPFHTFTVMGSGWGLEVGRVSHSRGIPYLPPIPLPLPFTCVGLGMEGGVRDRGRCVRARVGRVTYTR